MADHGGDVREVFGDPRAYVADLELPRTQTLTSRQWVGIGLPAVALFAGMTLLFNGLLQLLGAAGLPLVPVMFMFAVLVIGVIALLRFDLLRVIVRRPVLSAAVAVLVIVALGVLASLIPGPSVALPPVVVIPVGVVLLAVGVLLLVRLRRYASGVTFPTS